jgi:hypothetical protein
MRLLIQTFMKVSSVILLSIHNRGPFRAFPHCSQYASGKNLNVTEYFMYLLYYRSCFWVFVRDGMTLRFQRWQLLCLILLESWYWDIHHLGVHSSSQLVLLFHTALRTTMARRETSPIPPSPNRSWQWTHYVKWSLYKPLCPTHVSFRLLNPIKTRCGWLTVLISPEHSTYSEWRNGITSKVKVKVTLWLAVYRQSVRLGVKPLGTHDQIFF